LDTSTIPRRVRAGARHDAGYLPVPIANLLSEIEKFFVNYHAEYGETYRLVGCKGPRAAWKLVKDGARIWKRNGG
ncbi:MAG TPA: hypothetical protein VMU50_11485, partial [Polyangia bacterium]|nr:hypothetical protein [Polyangia bacterium]